MKKIEINAVFDKEIMQLLQELEIYDDVISGKFKCSFCDQKIILDRIFSVYPENNKIKFCCISPYCIRNLNKRIL